MGPDAPDAPTALAVNGEVQLQRTHHANGDSVVVHELAHQWYGDTVTPSDWRDLWMNEGMATYLHARWADAHSDRPGTSWRWVVRDWTSAEKTGMSIEVDADALGHDLNWGTAKYMRTMSAGDGAAPAQVDPAGPADGAPEAESPETESLESSTGAAEEAEFPAAVELEREPATTPF